MTDALMRHSVSNFKFEKGWEKKILKGVAEDVRTEMQSFRVSFSRHYRGRPMPEVRAALKREWQQKRIPADVTEAHFSEWATAVSEGTRITVKS